MVKVFEKELPLDNGVPAFVKPQRRSTSKWLIAGFLVLGYFLLNGFSIPSISFTMDLTENDIDYKLTYLDALKTNLAGNWSKIYTAEPHLAGTNYGLVEFTKEKFEEYGLKAVVDDYEILVSYPKDHDLNLIESSSGKVLYKAPLKEDVIDEDETTSGDDLVPTFLGYAANGNVTADYVYVNYGTKDDFEKLKALGVDVTGKIAVVRYGKIFRGLKVKFAQDNGAVGVLLYSDPGDDNGITPANGYEQYPKGPARQESSVQRGSVQFLGGVGAYPGDPTTPGYASKPGCVREDPHKAIGKIPALPISYREVKPILAKLNGHGVKLTDKDWIGELEGFEYYTGPSKKVELNLYNDQDFNISTLSNVYGEIEGAISSETIVIGNHRDAWIKGGAGDPNSGSASMLEIARALGELKAKGYKFKRNIVLMSWDGEEYGLLGSTEYGEFASQMLKRKVVAYLNVDVSVSGPVLGLEGCPSLFNVLKKVAGELEYPEEGVGSLLDHFLSHHGDKIGALGSGSDYTVFLEHLGIPSVDMGFGGGKDSPIYHYHSNYDSYHWMEKYGDKGFVFHNLMAKFLGLVALELSESSVLPLKLSDYADYLIQYFDTVKDKIPKSWFTETVKDKAVFQEYLTYSDDDVESIKSDTNGFYQVHSISPFTEFLQADVCPTHKGNLMYQIQKHLNVTLDTLIDLTIKDLADLQNASSNFDAKSAELLMQYENRDSLSWLDKVKLWTHIIKQNKLMQYFERNFIHHKGLHERKWFKHMIYASGRYTGYAGQVFPLLQEAIEDNDFERFVKGLGVVTKAFRRIQHQLE